MEIIFEALEGTPWYVYLIFFYVINIGVASLKSRTIKFYKVFIMPTVLTLWTLSIVYEKWDHHVGSFALWLGSLLAGSLFGYWALKYYKFRVDRKKKTITLPASRWTLILVLSVFAVRYYFGYLYDTHPIIPMRYIFIDFSLSGALIGIFIGRAFRLYLIYTSRSHL